MKRDCSQSVSPGGGATPPTMTSPDLALGMAADDMDDASWLLTTITSTGSPSTSNRGVMPRPGASLAVIVPLDPLRRAVGDRHGAVAVEVGRREAELLRRRAREMRDGGGDDVAAPGVLDRHRDAGGDAEVAHQPRLGQAADLGDLQVDRRPSRPRRCPSAATPTPPILSSSTKGRVGAPADRDALLVGHAGLLDIDVEVAHRVHHPRRVGHRPAGIGVGRPGCRRAARIARQARMRSMSSLASPPTFSWNLV